MTEKKSKIALTMGDAFGVGPEIAVSAASKLARAYDITIFGSRETLVRAADLKKITAALQIRDVGNDSFSILEAALKEVIEGRYDCLVTCPINKKEWRRMAVPFTGHTEFLAEMTATRNYAMMMANSHLKVALATRHVSLKDVPRLLTTERIVTAAHETEKALKKFFRIQQPRLGIAGLNPHCGEDGIFGDEETEIISPAVKQLKAKGIDADGPISGDSVFAKAAAGAFDAVVAMYHDQGLAPIKTLDPKRTVNITLGLPIIRTSVGHGTAEEIAWKGVADETNLIAAIEMAAEMVEKSRKLFYGG